MKKRLFSGVQPSGNLHIGNYLGAIKQFVKLQETYEAFFCVVDLHAITVAQDPAELRENSLRVAALYLAAGIDPKKSTIFIQSHVPAHAELAWILNTFTPLGELERMTQFKEKSAGRTAKEGIMAGLLNYPTLMAADILLYQTAKVPVGEDQIQHIEFTRSLAERFNNRFGETFSPLPEQHIDNDTRRIMGLDDPSSKMSKSASSHNNYIALLDSPEEIRRKIKAAVTSSEKGIRFNAIDNPAELNLLNIYSAFSETPTNEIIPMFSEKGHAEFKTALADLLVEKLSSLQQRYGDFRRNKIELLRILDEGAERASNIAEKTLAEVKQKIGFLLT